MPKLVIVESPAKASKIAGYLGPGYIVKSSIGHIRDLPTSAAQVPAKYKTLPWARTGVDVDDGFAPLYVVSPDKRAVIKELKDALAKFDELYLATDEDREGEAIAWHLLQELKPKVPVHRMVFHEITSAAIREAVAQPRTLDDDLVDAQETRRILDRLYGYEVSPVLWKKVLPKLSAGRVQSVATRLVVDRERERIAFVPAGYCDIEVLLTTQVGTSELQMQRTSPADAEEVAGGAGQTTSPPQEGRGFGTLTPPSPWAAPGSFCTVAFERIGSLTQSPAPPATSSASSSTSTAWECPPVLAVSITSMSQ